MAGANKAKTWQRHFVRPKNMARTLSNQAAVKFSKTSAFRISRRCSSNEGLQRINQVNGDRRRRRRQTTGRDGEQEKEGFIFRR